MHVRFERLEPRQLLAADVSVSHDVVGTESVGDEVTRIIRVFSDADDTEVAVRSSLTSQLDDVTWERITGYGKVPMESLYTGLEPDFEIRAGRSRWSRDTVGWPVGDLDGDGFDEVAMGYAVSDWLQAVIVKGPFSALDLTALPNDGSRGFEVTRGASMHEAGPGRFVALGDMNGDGYDDIANGAHVIFGAADLGSGGAVDLTHLQPGSGLDFSLVFGEFEYSRVSSVGDLDDDGLSDILVSGRDNSYLVWGDESLSDTAHLIAEADSAIAVDIAALLGSGFARAIDSGTQFAEPVGDVNHDGAQDAVIVGRPRRDLMHPVTVIYGGAGMRDGLIDLEAPRADDGFTLGNLLDVSSSAYDDFVHVAGTGDVNDDGIGDFVLAYGGYGTCDCTAGDKDNQDVAGGIVVVYGSENIASDGSFDVSADPHSLIRVSTVYSSARPNARLVDINQDGIPDIHMTVGDTIRDEHTDNYFWLGGSVIPNVEISHAQLPFDGFDGLNGLQMENLARRRELARENNRLTFFDVNGDGLQDALVEVLDLHRTTQPPLDRSDGHRVEVFLGRSRVPSPPVVGSGDIEETITLQHSTSAIYRVTGRLKNPEAAVVTTAVPVNTTDPDLRNNIAATQEGVWLEVSATQPSAVPDRDDLVEVKLSITNHGPSNARNVRIEETISASLGDSVWQRGEQLFPSQVRLDQLTGALGVAMVGPEVIRLNERQTAAQLNPGVIYWQLGREVGVLGDVNEDGIDDIYISSADLSGMEVITQIDHAFHGSPTFGEDGNFPPPAGTTSATDPSVTGDFNGDGRPDRVRSRGVTYVLYADDHGEYPDPSELDGTNGFRIVGATQCDLAAFIAAGDVNADGVDDLIISSRDKHDFSECTGGPSASVNVVFGVSEARNPVFYLAELDGENGFRMIDESSIADPHTSLVSSGFDNFRVVSDFDINGDGIDDILIGQPSSGSSAHSSAPYSAWHGAAFIVFGRSAHPSPANGKGRIDESIDLPVGATVTYTLRGSAGGMLSGLVSATPDPSQIQLVFSSTEVSLGRSELQSDLDGNGVVDFADFLVLSANFARSDAEYADGDINGDGQVTFADFLILRAEFG